VTIMNRNSLLSDSFHVGIEPFTQTHFILDKAMRSQEALPFRGTGGGGVYSWARVAHGYSEKHRRSESKIGKWRLGTLVLEARCLDAYLCGISTSNCASGNTEVCNITPSPPWGLPQPPPLCGWYLNQKIPIYAVRNVGLSRDRFRLSRIGIILFFSSRQCQVRKPLWSSGFFTMCCDISLPEAQDSSGLVPHRYPILKLSVHLIPVTIFSIYAIRIVVAMRTSGSVSGLKTQVYCPWQAIGMVTASIP